MKKLNFFANKRGSKGEREMQSGPASPSAPTDTLHRIVYAKEEAEKKWIEEQEEFRKRQRDHEIKMIEIEQAEVVRREKEVRKLNDLLAETRRKNQLVQDKVQEQIQHLHKMLEEHKAEHQRHEESIENDIIGKEQMLFNVKDSLDKRRKMLEMDEDNQSNIEDESLNLIFRTCSMYPTLGLNVKDAPDARPPSSDQSTMDENWSSSATIQFQKSPQLSNDSSRTEHSDTSLWT